MLATVILLQFCEKPETTKIEEKYPEKIQISSAKYNLFVSAYQEFIGTLDQNTQNSLNNFIKSKLSETAKANPEGRTSSVNCECSPGQSTCNASGTGSECCICCPSGKVSVCGVYFGVASCKCEGDPESFGRNSDTEQSNDKPSLVYVYPNRIFEMFSFLESQSVDVKTIKEQLKTALRN